MDRADIHRVALLQFATKGYHATSVRDLAAALGVTPPAIYYHFHNKDEVLTSLVEEILAKDLELVRTIQNEPGSCPLDAVLFAHVYGMCVGREEALVVGREATSLTAEFAARVAHALHQYRATVADVVAAEYRLDGCDLTLATRAALGLGSSVTTWFDRHGALRARDIAVAYVGYARGILDSAAQRTPQARQAELRASRLPDAFERITSVIDELVALRRDGARTA